MRKASPKSRLKPVSQWAIGFGLSGLCVGTALWFAVPPFGHYSHGCIFVPLAAGGGLLCGVGLLTSWRAIGWPLRILGILMVVLALAPLVLITAAVLKGLVNWPSPHR